MGPGSAYNYISMGEAVKDSGLGEKDVSKDLELQKELTEISGKLSVPVTVIGDEFVSGYDRVRIGNIIDSLVPPEE